MILGSEDEAMKKVIEKILNFEWLIYKKRKRKRLNNSNFSIIAPNCVGTIIYHDLNLPFLSPTINLTMGMEDFVRFTENLKWYLEKEILEIKGEGEYPEGMLGDIKINFVHYNSFAEAILKWKERKKRINWDNLFFIGVEKQGCTYETIQRFDKLLYKNKVIFTHIRYPEISSAYCIEGFEEESELGVITFFKKQLLKRRYMDDFDYVNFINNNAKGS